ncbi:unnamed protein product, partial [marine sediment metagenome]
LPKESNFSTLRIVSELQSKLGFNEDAYKEFELKQAEGNFTWNDKGKEFREIEVGEKAKEIVKEELIKLDKEKKITLQLYSLYEKFVMNKEDE